MRLILELAVCVFVLFGTKVILGGVVIWWLIPTDSICVCCNAPVLPLEPWPGFAWLLRSFGLARRWCMECGRESMGRISPARADATPRPVARGLSRRAPG